VSWHFWRPFCKFDLFLPKNSCKVQNDDFREKRYMRLFLRNKCRIHEKYQFWNSRPRVTFLFYFCLFDMEWPKNKFKVCFIKNKIGIPICPAFHIAPFSPTVFMILKWFPCLYLPHMEYEGSIGLRKMKKKKFADFQF
jgi:hypothetical protein